MSSKLNLKQPYGVVYGHDVIKYTQNGKNYDTQFMEVVEGKPEKAPQQPKGTPPKELSKGEQALADAKAFLVQILKVNPLSKAAVFKECESNNQSWDMVKNAAVELNIVKFSQKNMEMWKLPEEVQQ